MNNHLKIGENFLFFIILNEILKRSMSSEVEIFGSISSSDKK